MFGSGKDIIKFEKTKTEIFEPQIKKTFEEFPFDCLYEVYDRLTRGYSI